MHGYGWRLEDTLLRFILSFCHVGPGLNSGPSVWRQAPLSTEPSYWLHFLNS